MCKACKYEFAENGEPIISAAQHEVWLREHGDFWPEQTDRRAAQLAHIDMMDGSTSAERAWRQKLDARGIPWISLADFEEWCRTHTWLMPDRGRLDAYEDEEYANRMMERDEELGRLAREEAEEEDDEDRRRWASTSNPFEESPGSGASRNPFEESCPWDEDDGGGR